MERTDVKKGFTLAETIMVLAIVGVVVTASFPLFTKNKNAGAGNIDTPWKICDTNRNLGLCTNGIIADNVTYNTSSIPNVATGDKKNDLTINDASVKTPFDFIISDVPNYSVGEYNFSRIRRNFRIDTSPINLSDFENTNIEDNILIGTNAIPEPVDTASTASGNVIIGKNKTINGNKNIIKGNNNIIIGDSNSTGTTNHSLLIGKNLQANRDNTISIGNNTEGHIGFENLYLNVATGGVTLSDGDLEVTNFIYPTAGEDATLNFYESSDEQLKNVKGNYNKGLKEVLKLDPVVFTYKKDKSKEKHYGLIAQDVQKVFPEAVHKLPDGYLGIDNDPIFFAMMNAVKEIDEVAEQEQKRNLALQEKLEKLIKDEPLCTSITCKIKYFIDDFENWIKEQMDKFGDKSAFIKEGKNEV